MIAWTVSMRQRDAPDAWRFSTRQAKLFRNVSIILLSSADDSKPVIGCWLSTVDQVLAEEQPSNWGTANRTYWTLADHLGTVRDIANQAGVLKDHIAFDAFGKVTSETSTSINVPYGFTGFWYDRDTKLNFSETRVYDAATGTWVQKDFIEFDGGDTNLMRYVGNSATNLVDPNGMQVYVDPNKRRTPGDQTGSGANYGAPPPEEIISDPMGSHFRYGTPYDLDWLMQVNPALAKRIVLHQMHPMIVNVYKRRDISRRMDTELECVDTWAIGAAQGSLNVLNGGQNFLIDIANLGQPPLIGVHYEHVYWSKDLVVRNDPLHGTSVGLAQFSWGLLVPAAGEQFLAAQGMGQVATGGIHNLGAGEAGNLGLPLRSLSTQNIKVTEKGIAVVESHLQRFGNWGHNNAMLARLRRIACGDIKPTQIDLDFYAHELREFVRFRNAGAPSGSAFRELSDEAAEAFYRAAHEAALREYGIPLGDELIRLYTPEAQRFIFFRE